MKEIKEQNIQNSGIKFHPNQWLDLIDQYFNHKLALTNDGLLNNKLNKIWVQE